MINVCGKWPLAIAPGETGFFAHLANAQKNAACFEAVIQGLPTGLLVSEHFGGVGVGSVVIQNVLKPSSHYIWDIDEDCLRQLQATFQTPGIHVAYGDAKETMGAIDAGIVVLDLPYHTVRHHDEWEPNWTNVFKRRPLAVVWPDAACRRLHLHRHLYSGMLKYVNDNRAYIWSYSRWLYERYGYSIRRAAWHAYTYLLVQEGPPLDDKLVCFKWNSSKSIVEPFR